MIDTSSPTLPAVVNQPSCHGAGSSRHQSNWRRGLLIVGGAAATVGVGAFAVGQHWLTLATLTPLLFTLPCAVMMFACMRGMGGRRTPTGPTAPQWQIGEQALASPKAS